MRIAVSVADDCGLGGVQYQQRQRGASSPLMILSLLMIRYVDVLDYDIRLRG